MEIIIDHLTGTNVQQLLEDHLEDMHRFSPPESVHALDLEQPWKAEITFWSVWNGKDLLGCGALKQLGPDHGEIKSMRTAKAHRREGVASALLAHILAVAKEWKYRRISLETGSMEEFAPPRKLYSKFGFKEYAPFDGNAQDPNSVYMTTPEF